MTAIASPALASGLERVIVLDTETTGLLPYDRIITLAAICMEGGKVLTRGLHLIFDPRKDSHPQAEAVHGWDNWTTRYQDLFADHAADIRAWLSWGDKLVMHNAEFDMRYVQRELRKAEQSPLEHMIHCTLEGARRTWANQRCGLDDCVQRIGIPRRPVRHNALEDCFLTAALYLHMHGHAFTMPTPAHWPGPTNLRACEPRPAGALPRRTVKRPRCASVTA